MKYIGLWCGLLLACVGLRGESVRPLRINAGSLPRSTPEKQGVSSAVLLEFVEALDRIDGLHSVMLLRHGHVITEGWWAPYDAASNHELYSLSKSFTSTAVGLAVGEGRLSIDDEVLKFFPDVAPAEPGANLKAMRMRDLLTMTTGHQDEPTTAPDKVSAATFLAASVPHKPGTHFKYNTAATFMQSAIVQQQTKQSVLEYLQPRLFGPLGITQPVWKSNFEGISLGGYGLRVRTEDIAKFGQLYLNGGRWEGRQLLPASWVNLATSRQVSNGSNPASDWDQGYGFQFWRCRHGAYRGDGAFGQYCVVLPDHDAVLVITSGVKDMQAVLNVVWDHLLPAFKPRRLESDAARQKQLAARVAGLSIPLPSGSNTTPLQSTVLGRRFDFPVNDFQFEALTVTANPAKPGWILNVQHNGKSTQLACGHREWLRGRGDFGALRDEPFSGSGAWANDDTLQLKLCGVETPFHYQVQLHFDRDQLHLEITPNVGFGGTKPAALLGRAH